MLINIRVTPNAKKNLVVEENGKIKAYVAVPAKDGKANKAVIALLAGYLEVKRTDVRIVKGVKSRDKIVEIKVHG